MHNIEAQADFKLEKNPTRSKYRESKFYSGILK